MTDKEISFLGRFLQESEAIENMPTDMRGHGEALLMLAQRAENGKLIDAKTLKLVQRLVITGQTEDPEDEDFVPVSMRGEWRTCRITVSGQLCPDPVLVPRRMEGLIHDMREWQTRRLRDTSPSEAIRTVARFHHCFLRIHPFADGNGRTARALTYYLYRFAGLQPFIFTATDKHNTYYRCFSGAETVSIENYFLERSRL